MFTCTKAGFEGWDAEGEVLQEDEMKTGNLRVRPAQTNLERSPKLIWSGGAPGRK